MSFLHIFVWKLCHVFFVPEEFVVAVYVVGLSPLFVDSVASY